MKNDKLQPTRQQPQHTGLVHEVARPHRKRMSRYKLKKQTFIMQQILEDGQIF